MEYLLRRMNGKLHRLWIIISMVAIIANPVVGSLIAILPVTEKHCQMLLRYQVFSLIDVPASKSCMIWYVVGPISIVPPYVLCSGVSILYVIFCCCFRNLLHTHSKTGLEKEHISCKNFRNHLLTHDRAVKVLKDFQEVMSLPVFMIVVKDCAGIFFGFIALDPFGRISNPLLFKPWIWAAVFVSLTSSISFLSISLAAASVGEASKNASDVQQEMMKRVHASTLQDKVELFVFFKTHKTAPFNLSAGGVFCFTKGLVLAAIGSLLTYSLLLLQFS
ncbi:hypothetical protein AVEN_270451-1 [Araneus ventricosus]|uniref:Gustatory receptor n=1 Tax=Araneus ventricosus TaxID=182803 RepID=A0A4Y2B494_ARAVE|nr:hypothetical protein AVEN_270451-1 [Araneus ventricosus]